MRNLLILLTLVLVSCGPDGKHFRLDGKLLNLNQGEFLVYSPDGAIADVDTITLAGGRFSYEAECSHKGVIVIMMPGGLEVPVFVAPGEKYSVEGDAHSMKDIKVKGGEENKVMNTLREKMKDMSKDLSPQKEISEVIEKHPLPEFGKYLIRRYFLGQKADYDKALELLKLLVEKNPDEASLTILLNQVRDMAKVGVKRKLPAFNATDIDGKSVTQSDLSKGICLIASFASWDFESTNQIRRINGIRRDTGKAWKLVALSFDINKTQSKNCFAYDDLESIILFDGKMTESPVAAALGIYQTGVVIIVEDGVIKERSLYGEPLYEYLNGGN